MKIKKLSKCATKKTVAKVAAKPTTKTRKPAVKASAKKTVTFTIHADKGKAVYLAGSFNGWDPTAKKMTYQAKRGVYTASLKLAVGEHQYKFVIDGAWCADPENVNAVPNDQGTFNSVIVVK